MGHKYIMTRRCFGCIIYYVCAVALINQTVSKEKEHEQEKNEKPAYVGI